MEYELTDATTQTTLATGSTTLVTFDYRTRQTISLPPTWRAEISEFEGMGD